MAGDDSGKPPDGPKCRHYWIIQPATAPISPGTCTRCGQTKEFKNYVEAKTWGDEQGKRKAQKKVAGRSGDEEEWEDEDEEGSAFDLDDREIALAC